MRGAFPTGWWCDSLRESLHPFSRGGDTPPRTPPRRRSASRGRHGRLPPPVARPTMKSTDSLLRAPSGAITHVGAAARRRRQVEETAAAVFRGWGYEEILLPLFDHAEVFARGGGRWSERSSYRFTEGGDLLALRADFTALAARAAVTRLPAEAERLFYRGEVVRRPGRGLGPSAFREVGVEHFAAGPGADLEILMVALEVLERLGVDGFVFTLGHAGYPLGLLDEALAGAADRDERRAEALRGLWRRDSSRVRAALGKSAAPLVRALEFFGGNEVLEEAGKSPLSGRAREAVDRLTGIAQVLETLDLRRPVPVRSGRTAGFRLLHRAHLRDPRPRRRSGDWRRGPLRRPARELRRPASGRRFLALGGPDLRDPPRVIGLRPRPRPNHRGWWTGHRERAGGPFPEGPRRPEAGRRHSIRVRTLSSRGKPIRDVARTS